MRFKETLDLAVIVPEIARAFPGRFAVGVLLPEAARAIAAALRLPALAGARRPARTASTSAPSTVCATGTNTSTEVAGCSTPRPSRPPTDRHRGEGRGRRAAGCGD